MSKPAKKTTRIQYHDYVRGEHHAFTLVTIEAKHNEQGPVWVHILDGESIGEHTYRPDGAYGAAASIGQAHAEAAAGWLARFEG